MGEVVGVSTVSHELFYDVSLEDVIVKAVAQEDIRFASTEDMRSLLMAFLGGASPVHSARAAVLRQDYVAFLSQAVEARDRAVPGLQGKGDARFAPGDVVALRRASAWLLGTVRGVARVAEGIRYDVETTDELVRAAEQDLVVPHDAPCTSTVFLGRRMRFVADGYEQDAAYEGVVCMVEGADGQLEFALMFDDGDVLEGLTESDLAVAE